MIIGEDLTGVKMSIRGFSAIGLHMPKTHHNIGSVLRSASIYGSAFVAVSGSRYRKVSTDTIAAYRHMPLFQEVDLRYMIPYDTVPVAVDIIEGAQSLVDYVHPERAFYIFGPEDGTLGASITGWCRDVVYIPGKHCLNLAVSVATVLYDREAKQHRRNNPITSEMVDVEAKEQR